MAEDRVEKFPLFFDPSSKTFDVNYMRDVRRPEWRIGSLQQPLHLYQPDVQPTPEGGRVKIEPSKRKRTIRGEFVEVRKPPDPEQELWVLVSRDERTYRGTPDTLTNFAVLYQAAGGYHLQLVDHSIRMFEEKATRDAIAATDIAIQRMKQQKRHEMERLQRAVPFVVRDADEEIARRRAEAKEEKATQLFADRVEDGVREDGKISDDDAPDV
jgi:hypothetical protein